MVMYFKPPADISVGRIFSEVHRPSLREALLTDLFASFDLLYADQYGSAGDLIWQQYFYGNREAPRENGVFKWPEELMTLTFDLAEQSLKMGRTGWLIHIELKHHFDSIIPDE